MKHKVTLDLPASIRTIDEIREELGFRDLNLEDLLRYDFTPEEIKTLSGDDPKIDEELSAKFSKVFGTSPGYWARFDANHRAAMAAGKPTLSANGVQVVFAADSEGP